jgi:regulator of sigma E protease
LPPPGAELGVTAAIVGLAVLVLVHEAGHFFAARAVGMTPRKFYLGFGPPIVRKQRGQVEYGIGSLPLGGYVKIPGMSRPSPGDLRRLLDPLQAQRYGPELDSLDTAIERGDYERAAELAEQLRPALGEVRGFDDFAWSLAPDAYWRQKTWKRLTAIVAGPGVNLVFAVVLFTCLFLVASSHATGVVGRVLPNSPASAAGILTHDRIVSIAGEQVAPDDVAKHIRATAGKPVRIVVVRDGRRITIGPVAAKQINGAYRIGIALEERTGPGESLPAATADSVRLTWAVISDSARGIAHVATGRDTNQVSSSVGIVRVSAQAWRQGLRDFLFMIGLISLALGILNLLPILPLDGGHIVMAIVERIRGRTFPQAAYIRYSMVGFSLLVIVMYLGLRNDLFGGGG